MTGPYTTGPIIQSLNKPIKMLSDIMNHLVSKCKQSYTSRQVKDNNDLLKWKNHTIRPLAYSTIPVYTFIKDDLTRSYKKETKTYKGLFQRWRHSFAINERITQEYRQTYLKTVSHTTDKTNTTLYCK